MSNENSSSLRYTLSGWLMILSKLSAFIVIPILAYKFNNWWFLFGIAFVYLGQALGWKRGIIKIVVIIITAIVGVVLSVYDLFNQLITCYFFCFVVGFIVINLYRVIGLGDKTTRALIATTNPDVRQEIIDEVRPQLDEAMNALRNKKKTN